MHRRTGHLRGHHSPLTGTGRDIDRDAADPINSATATTPTAPTTTYVWQATLKFGNLEGLAPVHAVLALEEKKSQLVMLAVSQPLMS